MNNKKRYKEGHYTQLGIIIGMTVGVPLGLIIHNLSLGIAIGLSIGVAIGISLEKSLNKNSIKLTAEEKKRQRIWYLVSLVAGLSLLLIIYYFMWRDSNWHAGEGEVSQITWLTSIE